MKNDIIYKCIIGIINHSNLGLLKKCIHSIIDNTSTKCLITMVDNSGKETYCNTLKEDFPNIKVIKNYALSGFSQNMNILIKEYSSMGKYFLILNDDTEILPNAIDNLISFLDENDKIAAVSPRLIFPDGSPQLSAGFFNMKKEIWRFSGLGQLFKPGHKKQLGRFLNRFLNENSGLMKYFKSFYEDKNPWATDYISGTCMLIRSKALNDVGLLSEDYFIYSEDVDWCKRAGMKGWSVYVLPLSIVMHHQNKSMNSKVFVEREKSSLIYFSKYTQNRIMVLIYRNIIILLCTLKLIIVPLLKQKGLSKKELALAYIKIITIMLKPVRYSLETDRIR